MAVSSANNRTLDLQFCGRSLMYARKRRGPSTDPCGTPDDTGMGSELIPLVITDWVLLSRKLLIQLRVWPRIPKLCMISSKYFKSHTY